MRNLERELSVDLLERKRSGAKISDEGRELLPHIMSVLDAVDRLRGAAGDQHRISRMVRLGTVNTATVPLVIPTVREFRASHPVTQVELVGAQQAEIHRGLLGGAFDLGLVNYLGGDDMPPGFETTEFLRGRAVVCLRPDSPLATLDAVDADSLLAEPLVVMRSGYVMHRFVHRLLGGRTPSFSYSTDGVQGRVKTTIGRPYRHAGEQARHGPRCAGTGLPLTSGSTPARAVRTTSPGRRGHG